MTKTMARVADQSPAQLRFQKRSHLPRYNCQLCNMSGLLKTGAWGRARLCRADYEEKRGRGCNCDFIRGKDTGAYPCRQAGVCVEISLEAFARQVSDLLKQYADSDAGESVVQVSQASNRQRILSAASPQFRERVATYERVRAQLKLILNDPNASDCETNVSNETHQD